MLRSSCPVNISMVWNIKIKLVPNERIKHFYSVNERENYQRRTMNKEKWMANRRMRKMVMISNFITTTLIAVTVFIFSELHACSVDQQQVQAAIQQQPHEKVYRAAFDLGSCLFKLAVGEIDLPSMKVERIIAEKMITVRLGDDFKKHGTISKEVEEQAIKALQELIHLAREVGGSDIQMRGIATATFRKAGPRGAEVLSSLNQLAGSSSFIKEISPHMEGQIGLRSAKIAALENHPNDLTTPNIAWDSGSASFQIAYETSQGIKVLAGEIGGSDVRAIYATKILGLPKYDHHHTPYQSVSEEQIHTLIALIQDRIPFPDKEFTEALAQENGCVASIGDRTSHFSLMAAVLEKDRLTKGEIQQFLMSLANREEIDERLKSIYGNSFPYIVPQSALLFAVMDKLGIESVENYVTAGITKGLMITPEFWED